MTYSHNIGSFTNNDNTAIERRAIEIYKTAITNYKLQILSKTHPCKDSRNHIEAHTFMFAIPPHNTK